MSNLCAWYFNVVKSVYSFSAKLSRHHADCNNVGSCLEMPWTQFTSSGNAQYYADHLRSNEKWEEIWQHVISRSTELDLEMPQLPRVRRLPNKLDQSITAIALHQFQDIKTKCKVSYFKLVDLLVAELDRRLHQPGMNKLMGGVSVLGLGG